MEESNYVVCVIKGMTVNVRTLEQVLGLGYEYVT